MSRRLAGMAMAWLGVACGSSSASDRGAHAGDAGVATDAAGGPAVGAEASISADGQAAGDAFERDAESTADAPASGSTADAPASSGGSDSAAPVGEGGTALTPPALTWKRESTSPVQAIWGSGSTDIYAGGAGGQIQHSAGDGQWPFQTTNTGALVNGLWGSGPNDVYASTYSNAILHSTVSGTWDHLVQGSGDTFRGVWGSSATDVYVYDGPILQWTEASWSSDDGGT